MSDDKGTSHGPGGAILWIVLAVFCAVGAGLWLGGRDDGGVQAPRPEPWTGWKIIGTVALILVGLLAVGLVVYALVRLSLSLAAAWHAQRHQRVLDALALQRTASQTEADKARAALEAARLVPWAEHGRLGALVRQTAGGWQVVNLDAEAGALLLGQGGGIDRLLADPLTVAQLGARHQLELERARSSAFPSLTSYSQRVHTAGGEGPRAAAAPAVSWPSKVVLRDLISEQPTLGKLVLGLAVDALTGLAEAVTAALEELMHAAIGGSSGWGKSAFLRAVALQLATSAELCELAMIDLEGATFAPFAASERLLWPVADSEESALEIMASLVEEMNRRKALFATFPGTDSLAAYNARADAPLPPLVVLVDEATALLTDRSVHGATRTLALRARKFGVWLVLGGQDWKVAAIDSSIRNQLSTRVHFRASSPSQSRVLLGDGCAAAIEVPGRAFIQLPGRPLTEIQAPWVTVADIEAALAGQSGPSRQPRSRVAVGFLSDQDARLVLWAVEHNGGRFSVRALADAHPDEVTRAEVQALADRLAEGEWLAVSPKPNTASEVTAALAEEARAVLHIEDAAGSGQA